MSSLTLVQALEMAERIRKGIEHAKLPGHALYEDLVHGLLAAYDAMVSEAWEQHGCIRNSCSSCDFCWGWKGMTNIPELYSSACDFCKAYYELLKVRGEIPAD